MSFQIFKSNLTRVMESEPASIDDFASAIVREYDSMIKRGTDLLNAVPIQKGNTEAMKSLLVAILNSNNVIQQGQIDIGKYGPAFQAYWTGAIGALFPPPAIPAPGTIQNIASNTHVIANPGSWTLKIPMPPTLSTKTFIDILALAAQVHLTTVQGLIVTTSLYPTAPAPTPGPGVVNWTSYNVPG